MTNFNRIVAPVTAATLLFGGCAEAPNDKPALQGENMQVRIYKGLGDVRFDTPGADEPNQAFLVRCGEHIGSVVVSDGASGRIFGSDRVANELGDTSPCADGELTKNEASAIGQFVTAIGLTTYKLN